MGTRCVTDNGDDWGEWSAETEWSPQFLMHSGHDMVAAFRAYWERQRDDLGESDRWHVPDVWR